MALLVVISLGIIVGIYTTAFGASLWAERTGAHMVRGAMANLDHYRVSQVELQTYQAQFDTISTHKDKGHGCGADAHSSPDD